MTQIKESRQVLAGTLKGEPPGINMGAGTGGKRGFRGRFRLTPPSRCVMAGLSRSENGVASLAYVPAIHVFNFSTRRKTWMPGTRPGMTAYTSRHCRARPGNPYRTGERRNAPSPAGGGSRTKGARGGVVGRRAPAVLQLPESRPTIWREGRLIRHA